MMGHGDACRRNAVRRADPKDTLAAAQLANPGAVAAVIAVTGVPQASGMRVQHTHWKQAFVVLANDAAAEHLGGRTEPMQGDRYPGATAVVKVVGK